MFRFSPQFVFSMLSTLNKYLRNCSQYMWELKARDFINVCRNAGTYRFKISLTFTCVELKLESMNIQQ